MLVYIASQTIFSYLTIGTEVRTYVVETYLWISLSNYIKPHKHNIIARYICM